jgi:3-hydroxymyristoyl/3-hydroxydecanoyl-(acyl carrier protein) dehydratase
MQEIELDTRTVSLPDADDSFPRILSFTADSGFFRVKLDISQDLCWFRGHFPDQPVLPGVVQLHWAIIVACALFDFSGSPREIKRLKFKNIVTPPKLLELSVCQHGPNEVQFEFCSDDAQNSLGRLVFAEKAAC